MMGLLPPFLTVEWHKAASTVDSKGESVSGFANDVKLLRLPVTNGNHHPPA